MTEQTTETTSAQITVDEPVKNTGAEQTDNNSGAVTETATKIQETTQHVNVDITQTPEFKTALTAAIEKRIPQLKKQIAKTITGESDKESVDVTDLQRELQESQARARTFETRETVRDYLSDARNKINARPENMRAIEKLVFSEIKFDDEGKPENLREAIDLVKTEAPTLFIQTPSSVNGSAGTGMPARNAFNFNDQIRANAGYKSS